MQRLWTPVRRNAKPAAAGRVVRDGKLTQCAVLQRFISQLSA